jgi:TPR repeat protein
LTIDHDRAFGYYTQGAKQDHPASIYRTGVCYEVGAGPKRDHQRAVQYYRKAAALGDPAAMFKVGMILLEGTLGQARNPKEGVNLLKRAATQADETTPYALHELAILYEGVNLDPATGIVPVSFIILIFNVQDPSYAFELYLKASKLGYAPSQYKLGLSHEYGHLGLAIDAKRSIAWYTKAAQQGEAEAELALSGWYLTGFEPIIQQSDKEAYLWARKAANKGLAKAEYAVGYFLEHGVGSEQNLEEARKWYIRSAGQGNSRAIARLSDRGQEKREAQQIKPIDWRRSKDAQNGNCIVM